VLIRVADMDRPRWRELTEQWQHDELLSAAGKPGAPTLSRIGHRLFVDNDELLTWLESQSNTANGVEP
jgi:hypothetical protein